MGKVLYEASQWITRLVWVNLVWLFFIIAGLGIFGIMPATIALYTVTRRWANRDFDVSVWQTFKKVFKQEFIQANLVGSVFFIIGLFLFIDLRIANAMQGTFSVILYFFIFFLLLLLLNAFLHFFPIYVHFHYSIKNYIKQSFIISLISPVSSMMIIVGLFFIGYLIKNMPGLLPFVSGVLPAYWIMTVCLRRFRKLEPQAN
ncbi:membrane protein [Heyndrickxia sporothermodurans]|nr:membrane protein [Heyndrickxia sporothermodurans]